MRLRLDFNLDKDYLDQNYRFAVISCVKSLLTEHYPEEYERRYGQPKTKGMTFSVHLPGGEIGPCGIRVESRKMSVLFSDIEAEFLVKLYNAALAAKGKQFPFPGGTDACLKDCRFEFPPAVSSGKILIKFLSPLVVRRHTAEGKDYYMDYEDEQFSEQLNACVKLLVERLELPYAGPTEITLTPVRARRTVVKSNGIAYTANYGTFLLEGEPQLLQILYQTGLGSRRSEGHGQFSVLSWGGQTVE